MLETGLRVPDACPSGAGVRRLVSGLETEIRRTGGCGVECVTLRTTGGGGTALSVWPSGRTRIGVRRLMLRVSSFGDATKDPTGARDPIGAGDATSAASR